MGRVNNELLLANLNAKFNSLIETPTSPFGLLTIETNKETIISVLSYLKHTEELSFNYLTDITAVHYPDLPLSMAIVYHLHSLPNNIRIRIKVFIDGDKPEIPTATNLWNGANWMERETYDFFGIQFIGHPNLTRILNMDDMEVFPMRKEHPLEDPNRVDKKDFFFGR